MSDSPSVEGTSSTMDDARYGSSSPTRRKRSHESMERSETATPKNKPPADANDGLTAQPPALTPKKDPPPPGTSTPMKPAEAALLKNAGRGPSADDKDTQEGDESDPSERIGDFDWEDLEARYHEAMKQQDDKEQKIYQDFDQLMRFFQQWANSSRIHEVDRTYKRLRTRMAHVQHSERLLEERREHYSRVVQAFQSALNLLNAR